MSTEEFDNKDVIVSNDLIEQSSPDLVPTISKELEPIIAEALIESEKLDKGNVEFTEMLNVTESLEAYLTLIRSAGAVGLNPQAAKVLRIGLESLSYCIPGSTITASLENIDYSKPLVLRDNISLESSLMESFNKAKERLSKLFTWLIEQAHRVYTRYIEGINRLDNALNKIEKMLPDAKTLKDHGFTIGNANELMIEGELSLKALDRLTGLTRYVSKDYPKDMIEALDKSDKILKEYVNSGFEKDDLFSDYDFASWHQEMKISEKDLFPGNMIIKLNVDEYQVKYIVEKDENATEGPSEYLIDVAPVDVLKYRHKLLRHMVDDLESAAVENKRYNVRLEAFNKKMGSAMAELKSNDNMSDDEKVDKVLILLKGGYSIKNNTPSMLNIIRYIISRLSGYIAILNKEVELSVKEGSDKEE